MNKKYIVILSLMITFEFLTFCKIILTDIESDWFKALKNIPCTHGMLLTLNLPQIGKLDLYHAFDSTKTNLYFISKASNTLNLSPAPIVIEDMSAMESNGDLELRAKVKVFGKDAKLSVKDVKRSKIELRESAKDSKLELDISEITLEFNFDELSIKLFDELNLKFNSAYLVLSKDKPYKFHVKSDISGHVVDFEFFFSSDGKTVIKYNIQDGGFLSKVFSASDLNLENITLKHLLLTNEYNSSTLFSKSSHFDLHGNAFADVQIIEDNLPINLIDLPAIMNYKDEKYNVIIKLPQFNLPILGMISQGLMRVSSTVQLTGYGILNLPQIGTNSYKLNAIYEHGKISLRGNFDNSIKYENLVIEAPKFIIDSHTKSIKIFGKSIIQGIKCLIDLTIKDLDLFGQIKPELRIRALQRSWKPFVNSSNKKLSNIELKSPRILLANIKGKQEVTITGHAKILNDDFKTQINFMKTAKGLLPVAKINLDECWKISDSFVHVKKFDHFKFKDAQFILSDTAFFDPNLRLFFNRGINFAGKLIVNKDTELISNSIALTNGDIFVSGSIADDLGDFILQAPLSSGLSTKSELFDIGPMYLELNSNAPLSIISSIAAYPTPNDTLNFVGNFKLNGKKLIFDSISTQLWNDVFSVRGLNMVNPRLIVTIDNDHFSLDSMPDSLVLEGLLNFGKSTMYARSKMSEDFNKLTLTGVAEHFWLNELAYQVMENKQSFTLPPLEMKDIRFTVSSENGLVLDAKLRIFGFDIAVNSKLNSSGVKITGSLPKLFGENMEIIGKDCKSGPNLAIEAIGDKNYSKLIGKLKFGKLIEINDPILIDAQGCSFESNTIIGEQKLGIKIVGKSLGFIKIPEFTLSCVFKKDAVDYFKKSVVKELEIVEGSLKAEIDRVISDIKTLENNLHSISDSEHVKIGSWALEENKRKLNKWLELGLIKQDKKGDYDFSGITEFDLTDIKFNGSAEKIIDFKMPLEFVWEFKGKKHESRFVIDFANFEESIIELAREITLLIKENLKE